MRECDTRRKRQRAEQESRATTRLSTAARIESVPPLVTANDDSVARRSLTTAPKESGTNQANAHERERHRLRNVVGDAGRRRIAKVKS
jgi:hypothetical protein